MLGQHAVQAVGRCRPDIFRHTSWSLTRSLRWNQQLIYDTEKNSKKFHNLQLHVGCALDQTVKGSQCWAAELHITGKVNEKVCYGSSPINHSWHQKTWDTGLPDGQDCYPRWSLCVPSFSHSTGVWWSDRFAVAYTALAKLNFAVRCKN